MQTDQRRLEHVWNYKERLRTFLKKRDFAGAAALKKAILEEAKAEGRDIAVVLEAASAIFRDIWASVKEYWKSQGKRKHGEQWLAGADLKKICEKVMKKGVQGELECIVVRDDLSEAPIATNREDAPAKVIDKCPALKQLDDPVILGHLRDSRWTSLAGKIGEEVLAWQALQGCQRIPNRRSHDVHEKTLAKRFEDVLRRRYCAIGQWQCQQQLSADEIHFINGIPGVPPRGCSANAASPVNPWLPSAKEGILHPQEQLSLIHI